MARGKVDAANADWQQQLKLLPARQPAARACVALRLADYETALPELDQALAKQPGDPYWTLYRHIARRRLGQSDEGQPNEGRGASTGEAWPAPLIALLEGRSPADGILTHATTPGRRSEALFLLAAVAAGKGDTAEAEAYWKEIVSIGIVDLIEYAAARNELARL
jgi:cytochrome c-type biogenesis protein CcmH/NrfG